MSSRVKIARTDDLLNGQMKSYTVLDDHPVLLAKVDNKFHAVYGNCTHYGAPLADGALNGHRVVCPWHHACFDLRSGRHLEAPGLDGLPSYPVSVEDGDIYVELPDERPDRVPNQMIPGDANNQTHYVVVGGGAAGAYAVEGMREAKFDGKITLISAEDELPYDRPNCSKDYLADQAPEAWMPLRGADFYANHRIDLQTGKRVTGVDPKARKITLENGTSLDYDKLLLCPGGTPRKLAIPGSELDQVHGLRSLADSRQLRAWGKEASNVVVVGGSFIGLEGAQSLQKLGCKVSVVAPEEVPFGKLFGKRVGKQIQAWHEAEGVRFYLENKVSRIEGEGAVEKVVLENGEEIEADVVLVGIGVEPATSFLANFNRTKDGSLRVDEHLAVQEGIYAAGDVARYPYRGGDVRIEHWKVAAQQGRIAGMNMAGADRAYRAVPFFWSAQQGHNLRYVGHVEDFDDIHYDGSVEDGAFIAFYFKDGKAKAALGVSRDADMAAIQELMYEDEMPDADAIRNGHNWSA